MTPIRLVASDLDGTLVGADNTVRPRVQQAVRAVREGGVEVLLVTGRPFALARPILDLLGGESGLVVGNGAVVYERLDAPPVVERLLAPSLAEEAAARLHDAGWPVVVYAAEASGRDVLTADADRLPAIYVDHNRERLYRLDRLAGTFGRAVLAVGTIGAESDIRALAGALTPVFGERAAVLHLAHPLYHQWVLYVQASGVSKASAVRAYAERRGVAMAAVLALGDSLNDLDMIQAAGWGVAMGNAAPELQAAADAVVASVDDDGAAEALERFVLAGDGSATQRAESGR